MASKNDITGDSIQTKVPSKAYQDNYDLIFGKKEKKRPSDYQDILATEDCIINVQEESNESTTS